MKALFTVPSIQYESAGPAYTVPSLCKGLARNGVSVQLHVLDLIPDRAYGYPIVSHKRHRFPAPELGRSPEMLRGLKATIKDYDIVHSNGMWMFPNVYPAIAKRGTKCKLVYCPRGGLSATALSRSRVKKFIMGHLGGQYMALRNTDMFHAASMKELQEIRALGYKQPIALVPNGIDVPEVEHKPFAGDGRKMVFFGRIHKTKAVDHLVAAWGNVANKFPEWSLEIAGPDRGAVPMLKEMIAVRNIPRVSFVGELHGIDKYRFLAAADLYVLPSLTENFGITIAEALACGTPVIASHGCPWERLEEKSCGWWIDIGEESLTEGLNVALAKSPQALEDMGRNGKRWMMEDFSWDVIARKMIEAYKWLCGGGNRPGNVFLA